MKMVPRMVPYNLTEAIEKDWILPLFLQIFEKSFRTLSDIDDIAKESFMIPFANHRFCAYKRRTLVSISPKIATRGRLKYIKSELKLNITYTGQFGTLGEMFHQYIERFQVRGFTSDDLKHGLMQFFGLTGDII